MLDNLKILIDNLKAFNAEVELNRIVTDNSEEITKLQREQQAAGVDKTGKKRTDSYAPLTVKIKNKYGKGLGAVTDRVTFYMTGKLYASEKTVVKNKQFETLSPLDTFQKMLDRVGKDNFGLNTDSRLKFANSITLPQFAKAFKAKTGLNL